MIRKLEIEIMCNCIRRKLFFIYQKKVYKKQIAYLSYLNIEIIIRKLIFGDHEYY